MSFGRKPVFGPSPVPLHRHEDMLERGARANDAIPGAAPRKIELVLPRSALAPLMALRPHAALAAWKFPVAWMAGSHFDPPSEPSPSKSARRGAEMGRVAQNVAEDPHAQKARVEPSAAQILSTKNATGPGDGSGVLKQPRSKMSGGFPRRLARSSACGQNPRRRLPKQSERFDRIGFEIAALLATAAPAATGL